MSHVQIDLKNTRRNLPPAILTSALGFFYLKFEDDRIVNTDGSMDTAFVLFVQIVSTVFIFVQFRHPVISPARITPEMNHP